MGFHSASARTTVRATPQACFDALTDYERLTEWQQALKRVDVIERHPGGATVEYVLDAKVREVRYRLLLSYDAPRALASRYVEGDFQDLSAQWRFRPTEDGLTEVTLDLRLDPGWRIPGPIRALVEKVVMSRAMHDLQAHLR